MGLFHSSTDVATFDNYVRRYLRANTRDELNKIITDVTAETKIHDVDKYGIITVCNRKIIL